MGKAYKKYVKERWGFYRDGREDFNLGRDVEKRWSRRLKPGTRCIEEMVGKIETWDEMWRGVKKVKIQGQLKENNDCGLRCGVS